MKHVLRLLALGLFVLNVGAEAPGARPDEALKKLEVWTGTWRYEGTAHKTPLGEGGQFKGVQTAKKILGGSFVEVRWQDRGDYGNEKGVVSEGLDVYGYDAVARAYTVSSFERDGTTTLGTLTVDGNTWRQSAVRKAGDGRSYRTRYVIVFSEDGKRVTTKCEYSVDGVDWLPSWDGVMIRTGKGKAR